MISSIWLFDLSRLHQILAQFQNPSVVVAVVVVYLLTYITSNYMHTNNWKQGYKVLLMSWSILIINGAVVEKSILQHSSQRLSVHPLQPLPRLFPSTF